MILLAKVERSEKCVDCRSSPNRGCWTDSRQQIPWRPPLPVWTAGGTGSQATLMGPASTRRGRPCGTVQRCPAPGSRMRGACWCTPCQRCWRSCRGRRGRRRRWGGTSWRPSASLSRVALRSFRGCPSAPSENQHSGSCNMRRVDWCWERSRGRPAKEDGYEGHYNEAAISNDHALLGRRHLGTSIKRHGD